jgi:hypothetical protein
MILADHVGIERSSEGEAAKDDEDDGGDTPLPRKVIVPTL